MFPLPKLNILIAYPYFGQRGAQVLAEMGEDARLFIDSGAFTAWKAGRAIKLDDYCRFLETIPVKPWRYFTLDVVGDPAATARNYEEMLRRGFNPVPIYTRGESLDVLDHYYTTSDLVALGGLVGGGQRARSHVKALCAYANGRPLHLLGFTSTNWMKFLRPYSADSSNWESGGRYGQIQIYVGRGSFIGYQKKDAAERPPARVCAGIRAMGFDPYNLQYRQHWHGDNSMARWVSAASWVAASLEIERSLGTYMFLSLAADRADMLRDCFYGLTGRLDLGKAQAERAARAPSLLRQKAA